MSSGTSHIPQAFQGLFQAVVKLAVELDENDIIIASHGDSQRLLGANVQDLKGHPFSDILDARDKSLWNLLRHKALKGSKIGPVPLRAKKLDGAGTPISLEIYAVAENKAIKLALREYYGSLGLHFGERPASRNARTLEKSDFNRFAMHLETYVTSSELSPAQALVKLAGLSDTSTTEDALHQSLWALYSLLHDAGTEGAHVRRKDNSDKPPQGNDIDKDLDAPLDAKTRASVAGPHADMMKSARSAFRTEKGEINYVNVAGSDGISESEAVKAAIYSFSQVAKSGDINTMSALSGGYEKTLEGTKNKLRMFKNIVMNERFNIAIQPIVELDNGKLHHFEALARMHDAPFQGSPFEFMQFAESVGVIQEFDLAMTMKAISTLKRLKRIGYNVPIAVNISGHSIQSRGFLRHFFRLLEDCNDLSHLISFELTESSEIRDLDATNRILSRIRDFGHQVCLDDFGAGAAGLQYLRELKVDYVKIDGIYIQRALQSKDNRTFLKSIVDLCKALNIKTVGECVETPEQLAFLTDIGVTYGQGWLYGKPQLIDEAHDYLENC